jgi:FkbM family methyltransferase
VLDVGANTGQFASELRNDLGYAGTILSFEPLSTAYRMLEQRANGDPLWKTFHHALGDQDESREINVAANSESSSLLPMLASHLKSAPQSEYIGKETIRIKTLDQVFPALCPKARNVYLKMDTQGFEKHVLLGAKQSLVRIDTVQMELSLVPLYAEQVLFNEMHGLMIELGYTLIAIEDGFSDPASGQVLQADGIFHRFSRTDGA